MVQQLGIPIGNHASYCEVVRLTDKDIVGERTVLNFKYLMAIINHAITKDVKKRNLNVEITILENGIVGFRFRDVSSGDIYPKDESQIFAAAPIYEDGGFPMVKKVETSEIEMALREDIAKLEREIYRLKVWGKTHPSGIADMEANVKELYAKVAKAGV